MIFAWNGRGRISFFIRIIIVTAVIVSLVQSPDATFRANAAIKTQRSADKIAGGIRGIDVSKYNGVINWQKVATDEVDFAFIRATCGYQPQGKYQLNIDPLFLENARGAHQNGIKVGAYHVAWFLDRDIMLNEADVFLDMLSQVEITYPVILDIEYNPGRQSRDELSRLCKEFCDIVSDAGYEIFIYSYSNFFSEYLDLDKLGDYKLWVANYGEMPKHISHSIWQHTSSGSVRGISGDVDINVAYPDFEERKYAPVSVSRTVSDSIVARLRERYSLEIAENKLSGIHEAVNAAVQREINRQWNVSLPVNGRLTQKQLGYLGEIHFTSKTRGNITYLIQAKLFYLGYYKAAPTAAFDANTKNAIRSFQIDKGLAVTGELDETVLGEMFG